MLKFFGDGRAALQAIDKAVSPRTTGNVIALLQSLIDFTLNASQNPDSQVANLLNDLEDLKVCDCALTPTLAGCVLINALPKEYHLLKSSLAMTPLGSQTVASVTDQANSYFSNMVCRPGNEQPSLAAFTPSRQATSGHPTGHQRPPTHPSKKFTARNKAGQERTKRSKLMGQLLCLNCNQPGHFRRNCPQLQLPPGEGTSTRGVEGMASKRGRPLAAMEESDEQYDEEHEEEALMALAAEQVDTDTDSADWWEDSLAAFETTNISCDTSVSPFLASMLTKGESIDIQEDFFEGVEPHRNRPFIFKVDSGADGHVVNCKGNFPFTDYDPSVVRTCTVVGHLTQTSGVGNSLVRVSSTWAPSLTDSPNLRHSRATVLPLLNANYIPESPINVISTSQLEDEGWVTNLTGRFFQRRGSPNLIPFHRVGHSYILVPEGVDFPQVTTESRRLSSITFPDLPEVPELYTPTGVAEQDSQAVATESRWPGIPPPFYTDTAISLGRNVKRGRSEYEGPADYHEVVERGWGKILQQMADEQAARGPPLRHLFDRSLLALDFDIDSPALAALTAMGPLRFKVDSGAAAHVINSPTPYSTLDRSKTRTFSVVAAATTKSEGEGRADIPVENSKGKVLSVLPLHKAQLITQSPFNLISTTQLEDEGIFTDLENRRFVSKDGTLVIPFSRIGGSYILTAASGPNVPADNLDKPHLAATA